MMKKNYSDSKTILQSFIEDHSDNKLSGSAHFWLGKIYLFESNFRKAAIVFGEGVQKFPNSIKAAEMYYELSKSLKEMNKFSEACNAQPKRQLQGLGLPQLHKEEATYPSLYLAK